MPIEIINHSTSLDGGLLHFEFSDRITAYTYGITGFSIGYGSEKDHHLETFSIRFLVDKPADHIVVLKPVVEFHDSSGNHDTSSSMISVTVVAWMADHQLVSFGNTPPIASNTNYNIHTKLHAFNQVSFLSGFDLSYGRGVDHHVESIVAATNSAQQPGTILIGSDAIMFDASGNQSLNPQVSAGVLATYQPNPGFEMQIVKGVTEPNKPIEVEFHGDIDQAALLLVDFDLSYGQTDHHIERIEVGYLPTPGFPQIDGKTARFYLAECKMYDNSNNYATRVSYHMLAIGRYRR